MKTALEFHAVDILFSQESGRAGKSLTNLALQQLDAGRSRAEILSETGVVVGVAGATLTVRQGEISVLMGLSGSGKSTLLRAANGLNAVTRGSVRIGDGDGTIDIATCDSATLRRLRRGRIAMMFQQFGLLPWRTVRDNVGLGLELRGESPENRRRQVDEKLELVGLAQWADRFVGELSGGMQQRVGLARAFATDADILLMDEPFSALDPLIRTRLQDELLALQHSMRKTILFVTHDLDEALRIGDRISVLEGGRIIQTGSPEDIVMNPATRYVAEFVQHMNPLSVLRAGMVMRQLEAPDPTTGRIHFGPDGEYWITTATLGASTAGSALGERRLRCVDVDTPLIELIAGAQERFDPILVTADGRVAGTCTAEDILKALSRGRGAVKQASDAN